MKRSLLFCLLFLAATVPAAAGTYRVEEIPHVQRADRRRYVSNPDGILSPEAVARIDAVCASLRERGLAQVAVVAVDDIAGGDTFSFAVELFGRWGVGGAESDNGLGILLVKDLREIRFVTGGGVEGVLPDALCKRIQLKYMLPGRGITTRAWSQAWRPRRNCSKEAIPTWGRRKGFRSGRFC